MKRYLFTCLEDAPFRDCMGEEGVEEDMVLCLFLVQSLCSSGREWSKGQSGGRSLLGLCLTLTLSMDVHCLVTCPCSYWSCTWLLVIVLFFQ